MNRTVVVAAIAALLAGYAGPATKAHARDNGEPGEAVWHLRAGLNVAALSCRGGGRDKVAGAYSRLLTRHRTLLAAAYASEQRRYGGGLDRHLTQIYNRFALPRSPAEFCSTAADVASRAVAMDSAALSEQARQLLGELD
jgi:hypothetical protein